MQRLFAYRSWHRWSVVIGPFLAASPPFWPLMVAAILDDPEVWFNVKHVQWWAYLILVCFGVIWFWAYADLQFWRRDVRVTPDEVCSQLFGRTIYCLRWRDIKSISIIDDYNSDRLIKETRCRLQAGSKAIGFKDYIIDYPVLLGIVEDKAKEFSIPLTHEDRSGRATRVLRRPE